MDAEASRRYQGGVTDLLLTEGASVGRRTMEFVLTPWSSRRESLLRVCMRWTRGNLSEAEDLLSEACLRTMEAQNAGVEIRKPISFCATIINNLARDQRAARNTTMNRLTSSESEDLASCATAPDDLASVREALRRALAALNRAPRRQRSALLMRSLGNDYSCIARAVGTSEQNARKLVQMARAAVHSPG